jgi:hypothetical protein
MQKQDKGAYEQYQALKSGQKRFDYATLASLFCKGRPRHTWNDSVMLAAVVWNLSHGRPMEPTLVDAIVAERDRESLKTLYQYAIEDLEITNPDCWKFRVLILPHGTAGAPFATFDAVMCADRDHKEPWYVKEIDMRSLKVYSIAEPGFSESDNIVERDFESRNRFSRYTVFDNLTQSVQVDEVGTLYLQNLEEQIKEYAGDEMADLFHKFRIYADCMLEMRSELKLSVRYFQKNIDLVYLEATVYKVQTGAAFQTNHTIVEFGELLSKEK